MLPIIQILSYIKNQSRIEDYDESKIRHTSSYDLHRNFQCILG